MYDPRLNFEKHEHLDEEAARSFLRRDHAWAEWGELVRLVGLCRECRHVVMAASDSLQGEVAAIRKQIDPVIAKHLRAMKKKREVNRKEELQKLEVQLRKERSNAPGLFVDLMAQTTGFAQRYMRVASMKKYHSMGFCEYILEQCWELRCTDAGMSHDLAQLGVIVADNLSGDVYSAAIKADMQARAWMYLANAQRIQADLVKSKGSFGMAAKYLREGSGDPIEEGHYFRLNSALYYYRGEFGQAEYLADQAMASYEIAGDKHLVGTALASKGAFVRDGGDLERGTRLLRHSLELMDPARGIKHILAARQNLAIGLVSAGHPHEAQQLVRELRPAFEDQGDRLSLARLDWLEGMIAAAIGHTSRAEFYFRKAIDEFMAQGIGYDAAESCLELSTLYVAQARTRDLQQLAAKMVPIFEMQDMHKHAMAALLAFTKAIELDKLNSQIVDDLKSYWKLARRRPDLKFRTEAEPDDSFFD